MMLKTASSDLWKTKIGKACEAKTKSVVHFINKFLNV